MDQDGECEYQAAAWTEQTPDTPSSDMPSARWVGKCLTQDESLPFYVQLVVWRRNSVFPIVLLLSEHHHHNTQGDFDASAIPELYCTYLERRVLRKADRRVAVALDF